MTARLIPDLDDELTAALGHLEELCLEVAAWEDEDPPAVFPAPLAGRQALDAVRRIWDAVAPTQGELAIAAGHTGRLLAPDGSYEHMPLRLAGVDPAHVAVLAAAAAIFGDPHAPGDVRAALANAAETAYGNESRLANDGEAARTRLVMTAAQTAGLLDLAPDRDTEVLTALIEDAGPGDDIVLTQAGEAAYQRYAARANAMWTLSDSLARYLY